jgi:hypothetical protein
MTTVAKTSATKVSSHSLPVLGPHQSQAAATPTAMT